VQFLNLSLCCYPVIQISSLALLPIEQRGPLTIHAATYMDEIFFPFAFKVVRRGKK